MKKINKKIIFTSGGTGGHIFPTINIMNYFSKRGYDVLIVTDKRGDNFIKENFNFRTYIINADTPIKKNFFKKILSYTKILLCIIESFFILKKERPHLIFGLGGYVSFPISFASKFFNIPLFIFENNLILGRANQQLLRLSKKILLGKNLPINFPSKYQSKACQVGDILSEEIINYSAPKLRENNKAFSILVLGGSQAAEIFGVIIPPIIKMIKDQGCNIKIIQQCIETQKESIVDFYNKNNIKNNVFTFKHNILDTILSADLAISRCGASTTAELVHTLTPFIAIPFPFSMDDHQLLNAKYYEKMGCCWLMEQKNINNKNLFNLIIELIKDTKKLNNVKENMKKNFSKDVYKNIDNIIKEFI